MPINDELASEDFLAAKAAKAAYDREYRAKNAEKIAAKKRAYGKTSAKKAADKRWVEEHRERSREIKQAWRERNPEASHEYYAKNADRILEKERLKNAANPELNRLKTAEWVAANPERAKEGFRRCYENKRETYIMRARMRRQHIEERATPGWANKYAIAAVYKEAAERGMHVDHIIPLKGKNVSGLHVEYNLQLLEPLENRRKGNRYAD